MKGQLFHEVEVKVSADDLWDVYGTLKLGQIVAELIPHVVQRVEHVEGDGGVGTVLKVVLPEGTPLFSSYKERLTKVDEEKRVKEAEVYEGGYLDHGFNYYKVTFEIIEKEAETSIIKSTINYDLDEKFAANVSLASTKPVEEVSNAVAKYLTKEYYCFKDKINK